MRRREFLGGVLCAPGVAFAQRRVSGVIDEYDPGNVKLCHRVDARRLTDDDMQFLRQIGLRWLRVEFGETGGGFDELLALKQRLARHDIRIYSGVHYAYRSLSVQLGRPGRD